MAGGGKSSLITCGAVAGSWMRADVAISASEGLFTEVPSQKILPQCVALPNQFNICSLNNIKITTIRLETKSCRIS